MIQTPEPGVWAMLWLVLTFVAWLGVTIHDLALIGQTQKVRGADRDRDREVLHG